MRTPQNFACCSLMKFSHPFSNRKLRKKSKLSTGSAALKHIRAGIATQAMDFLLLATNAPGKAAMQNNGSSHKSVLMY